MYISGPGATGKSVFAHVLSALLSPEAVVATRLKDLNQDKFEVINLAKRDFVIINDVEDYTGDMSVLKAFVGQDILKGSRKYVQGTFKVQAEGIIIALANHPFSSSKDSGAALSRRLLPFQTTIVSKSRVPLITPAFSGYTGALVAELPGILNWVLDTNKDTCYAYLTDTINAAPSMKQQIMDARSDLSPFND